MSFFLISLDKIITKLPYTKTDTEIDIDVNRISETYFNFAQLTIIHFDFWSKNLSPIIFTKLYEKKINTLLTKIPYSTLAHRIVYGDAVLFIDKINFSIDDVKNIIKKN